MPTRKVRGGYRYRQLEAAGSIVRMPSGKYRRKE